MLKIYLEELKKDKGDNYNNILAPICLRVYDNYILCKFGEVYILGKKPGTAAGQYGVEIESIIKNISESPELTPGYGGNNKKNKNTTHKNIKYNKNVTMRNKKHIGGVGTEKPDELTKDKTDYNNFMRFCVSNEEKMIDTNNIAKKSIFISTHFDIEDIKALKRTSGISNILSAVGSTFTVVSNFFKSLVIDNVNINAEEAKESLQNELLQKMKTDKTLLPTIFKNIFSIGFLIDGKDDLKYKETGGVQRILHYFGKNTITDSNIQAKKINWVNFHVYYTFFGVVYDAFEKIVRAVGLNGLGTAVANIISGLLVTAWSTSSTVGGVLKSLGGKIAGITGGMTGLGLRSIVPLVTGTLGTASISTGVAIGGGVILTGTILYALYACWNPDLSKDEVIGNALNATIFDLVTSINLITVETLDVNPSILFLNYIDDKALSGFNMLAMVNYTQDEEIGEKRVRSRVTDSMEIVGSDSEKVTSRRQNWPGGPTITRDKDITSINPFPLEFAGFSKLPRAHTNILNMAVKYNRLFKIEEDIDVQTIRSKKTPAPKPKDESYASWFFSFLTKSPDEKEVKDIMEVLKIEEESGTSKFIMYTIVNYVNDRPDPPGIKSKLKNLNIPLSSFYYALSVVKSTYNPTTGKMLKEYYDDKAKFMETYKDKLK
jgi:hypothetical protein